MKRAVPQAHMPAPTSTERNVLSLQYSSQLPMTGQPAGKRYHSELESKIYA